jgi:predicted metal-binding membrane protein
MDVAAVGRVGLTGIKGKAGRGVAHAVASRTNVDEELLAAVLGGVFLALWAYTAVKTIRAIVAAARGADQPDLAVE